MKLDRKNLCPLRQDPETGEMKPCAQLDCAWFTKIDAKDDEGNEFEDWGCSVPWLVWLGVKNIQTAKSGLDGCQAATESFRNEMLALNGVAPRTPSLTKRDDS